MTGDVWNFNYHTKQHEGYWGNYPPGGVAIENVWRNYPSSLADRHGQTPEERAYFVVK